MPVSISKAYHKSSTKVIKVDATPDASNMDETFGAYTGTIASVSLNPTPIATQRQLDKRTPNQSKHQLLAA